MISLAIFCLLGGLTYIIRGGGFGDKYSDIASYLASLGLPSMRNLFIVALFLLPPVNFWYLSSLGIHAEYLYSLVTAISIGYIATLVSGWGAYYSMGTWEYYYSNHTCIAWIDWILCKLYGPEWIPASTNPAYPPDPVSSDLIISPTGLPNSNAWLYIRALTGMALRMTYSIVLFGLIGLVKYHFTHDVHHSLETVLFFIPMMLTTFIYDFFVNAASLAAGTSKWRFLDPIGKSEIVTGIWLNLLIVGSVIV